METLPIETLPIETLPMETLQLSRIARLLNGKLRGADTVCTGVSTDSRRLNPGDLFIALRGPNFDGHAFIATVLERGARGALVERTAEVALSQVQVADTRLALGRLGASVRASFSAPLIAVTGSNGKTTVKEMIAAILRASGAPFLATRGNLNNDIGLPLMLLELRPEHAFAVIEMGANHPGEIAYLTSLARPSVALITNAGPAHLEGFGDLDGVAHAKGEIFQGLGAKGVAVINGDDAYADHWRRLNADRQVVDFGLEQPAQVTGEMLDAQYNRFRLRLAGKSREIALPLPGRHNVCNALAAAAAAYAAGIDLDQISQGLQSVTIVKGRLRRLPGPHDSVIIDDTYNANPASLGAALAALTGNAGVNWLVLGDMAELGAKAGFLHEQAGIQTRAAGFRRLFTLGEHSQRAAAAFGPNGVHFADVQMLVEVLNRELAASDVAPTVLIKGSRSMAMERIVQALAVQQPGCNAEEGRF